MFDPFKDFATQGYLRNILQEKDARIIKQVEHELFIRHQAEVKKFLASQGTIGYSDFLAVHRMLFSEFYPWAGQDRATTMPDSLVSKADILFCHPMDCRRAVEAGLRLGQDMGAMNQRPGEVMGLFAYGHPFLDGNGRTMLLVHIELAHRAGFSIAWEKSSKTDYLAALSNEIKAPGRGTLDAYLLQHKGPCLDREEWGAAILAMKGLDGQDENNRIDGDLSDAAVAERYREFEKQREHRIP